MIIDFHTHLGDIFPRHCGIQIDRPAAAPQSLMISSSAIAAPDRLFYRHRPQWWTFDFLKHGVLTLRRRKRARQGMVIPNLLNAMRRHKISASVVLPIEYLDGIDRSAALLQACRQHPELMPFCSVHPHDPHSIEKLHQYIRLGARGMKLHPIFQRIAPTDPQWRQLCAEYAPYRLPLLVHCGLTGREGRFQAYRKWAALELLWDLPKQFPHLPIILGHAGISQYLLAIQLAEECKNVYLELSGQPAAHIQHALRTLGPERLLFGSDWPFWTQVFPLQAVRKALKHDDKAVERVLAGNAEALLGG